ncbi:MAG TPA: DUF3857 domain-containing protein [Candidatus Angelobacter sp.]
MRMVRLSIFLLAVFAASLCSAQKDDWLPITDQDLQIKEVPGNPGAPAIQLYYAQFVDDSNFSQFIYHRIKILNEQGKQYADVEINAGFTRAIKDLKARTIRPDGSVVDFTGKPFDKTVIKGHGVKWTVKSFTLPEVSVGSIVEYKYKEVFPGFTTDNWELQHNLFTVREQFTFKPYDGPMGGFYFYEDGSRLAWVSLHVSKDQQPRMTKDKRAELEVQNIPALEPEEYMPPESNYKSAVHFFYVSPEIKSTDGYWEFVGKRVYESLDRFIGDHKEARAAAAEAIGSETDPEKKLRKLYARAQQIRNLTYERERTEEERNKEKLKTNEGVSEILRRGYGDRGDVNLVFVAMARAAGFDASALFVSNREESFFSREVLSLGRLDALIADVKVNGKDLYLDPGTRYCPFGLLRWMRTSTPALKPDKSKPSFVNIPPLQQDKAVIRRNVTASLDAEGALKGEVVVQFTGIEALERRLDAVKTDEAGRTKQLEDEFKTWVPTSSVIKLIDAKGWDTSDDPLIARFSIEIPAYASIAGKRLVVPSCLFQVRKKGAFTHAERKYPVYFPYAYSELDSVSIKVPPRYTMEGSPQNQKVTLPYAAYQNATGFDGAQFVTQRVLAVNGILFPLNQYSEIKDFFSKVQAGDEQQAVLHSGDASSASKGN